MTAAAAAAAAAAATATAAAAAAATTATIAQQRFRQCSTGNARLMTGHQGGQVSRRVCTLAHPHASSGTCKLK